jgi:hypothetical protein
MASSSKPESGAAAPPKKPKTIRQEPPRLGHFVQYGPLCSGDIISFCDLADKDAKPQLDGVVGPGHAKDGYLLFDPIRIGSIEQQQALLARVRHKLDELARDATSVVPDGAPRTDAEGKWLLSISAFAALGNCLVKDAPSHGQAYDSPNLFVTRLKGRDGFMRLSDFREEFERKRQPPSAPQRSHSARVTISAVLQRCTPTPDCTRRTRFSSQGMQIGTLRSAFR